MGLRALLDLTRQNEAAVLAIAGRCQALLGQASEHLVLGFPSHGPALAFHQDR